MSSGHSEDPLDLVSWDIWDHPESDSVQHSPNKPFSYVENLDLSFAFPRNSAVLTNKEADILDL